LVYDLGMPDNLPRNIEENVLVFDINAKIVGVLISGGLSPLLCIPEIGCN
jgi:repressor of nif and glnA expression